MDLNYTIPSILCALGFGLVLAAGMLDDKMSKHGNTKATTSTTETDKQTTQRLFHCSRTEISDVVNKGSPGQFKPKGLWFTYSKTEWIKFASTNGQLYKKGEKLFVYSITFSSKPKMFVVKDSEHVKSLCDKICTREPSRTPGKFISSLDWDILQKEGFDGVQLLQGAMDMIKEITCKQPDDTLSCELILQQFDVDSGCLWNVDKVVLKKEGTVTV